MNSTGMVTLPFGVVGGRCGALFLTGICRLRENSILCR
jgi:hypothetical protein